MNIIDYITQLMRDYPVLTLFLTVGIGFFVGRIKIRGFALGSVTAVLLVGVVVGQAEVQLSSQIKTLFFMMFLFSIGYSVGPKFFRSLRGMGLRQALFAVLMSGCCMGSTILMAKLFGYSAGETVGLFSGSQTCSALLGVGGDAVANLPISDTLKQHEINIMPVCYAVTYIFGTLGTVIILGNLGPKLLGGIDRVREQTALLEERLSLNAWENDPAFSEAGRITAFRVFRATGELYSTPRTVGGIERHYRRHGIHLYIERVFRGDKELKVKQHLKILPGDYIVVAGYRHALLDVRDSIGEELENHEMLNFPVSHMPVKVASQSAKGKTIDEILGLPAMHGVLISKVKLGDGKSVSVDGNRVAERNTILILSGRLNNVERAARQIGYADRPTNSTDIMFVGLALFIGGFIGVLSVVIDNVPISLGTSGGALISGLVFGWLRSRHPTFGQIPDSALWLMNHLGLNVFIAVVGISAAPEFVTGLREVGLMLFVVGAVATSLPLFIGLWLGHKVFKFNPAITLGCCAGTRTCTAALGAVQDALGSTLPAMGYTVTYAVSNILLVIWGILTVAII